MLRYALNAAISMDAGAPQAHELLLANETTSVAQQGEDKPSPLLCLRCISLPSSSIVGAMACPRPGACTIRLCWRMTQMMESRSPRLPQGTRKGYPLRVPWFVDLHSLYHSPTASNYETHPVVPLPRNVVVLARTLAVRFGITRPYPPARFTLYPNSINFACTLSQ